MTEKQSVENSNSPLTRESLRAEFKQFSLDQSSALIVHSSLSSLGWVCGGAVAVVQALMDSIGNDGTIVMPTHSAGNSEPSYWENPAIPESWWPVVRESMPAFDPLYSPTLGMGKISEVFRQMSGVKRSNHPLGSFAAYGKYASQIIANHSISSPFGENSPLKKIYDLNGDILLIGVGHESNTSIHLAEERSPNYPRVNQGAAINGNDGREWVEFDQADYNADFFEILGAEFEKRNPSKLTTKKIGNANVKLLSQRILVDFAEDWIRENPSSWQNS